MEGQIYLKGLARNGAKTGEVTSGTGTAFPGKMDVRHRSSMNLLLDAVLETLAEALPDMEGGRSRLSWQAACAFVQEHLHLPFGRGDVADFFETASEPHFAVVHAVQRVLVCAVCDATAHGPGAGNAGRSALEHHGGVTAMRIHEPELFFARVPCGAWVATLGISSGGGGDDGGKKTAEVTAKVRLADLAKRVAGGFSLCRGTVSLLLPHHAYRT